MPFASPSAGHFTSSSASSKLAYLAWYVVCSTAVGTSDHVMQVDVFSFGVVIYELLIRQVTSAVVSQSGDASMPEMYANKVNTELSCLFWLCMTSSCTIEHSIIHVDQLLSFAPRTGYPAVYMLHRQADKIAYVI